MIKLTEIDTIDLWERSDEEIEEMIKKIKVVMREAMIDGSFTMTMIATDLLVIVLTERRRREKIKEACTSIFTDSGSGKE